MMVKFFWGAALVVSVVGLAFAPQSLLLAQDYKVGDRLDNPKAGDAKGAKPAEKPADKSGATAAAKAPVVPGQFREIKWEEFSPKDWDPFAAIRDLNFAVLKDSDPKAMEALNKLTEARNKAPIVPELAGQAVRLSGFIIPLTKVKDDVHDFLLVPYFGACIHTPPPPSNMVIHVVPDKPFKGGVTMDAVTVSGTVSIERTESPWGSAGYKLSGKQVVKYQAPGQKN